MEPCTKFVDTLRLATLSGSGGAREDAAGRARDGMGSNDSGGV